MGEKKIDINKSAGGVRRSAMAGAHARLRRIFTIFLSRGAPTWRLLALTLIRFRRELESRTEVKCFPCAGQNKSASVVLRELSGQR